MKRALIDWSVEAWFSGEVSDCHLFCNVVTAMNALRVFGLRVAGSAPSPLGQDVVRLIVEGDALPDECSAAPLIVRPIFSQECHGDQRLVKVTEIWVVDKPKMILAA